MGRRIGKGVVPYPSKEFLHYVYEIADYKCELCGRNVGCSVHHIIPRSVGITIHKLWNTAVLCEKCHYPKKRERRERTFVNHMANIMRYCIKWKKVPKEDWEGLRDYCGKDIDKFLEKIVKDLLKDEELLDKI